MYYDAGKVVTCGSKIRRDFVATTTSTALQRLKDAGTIRLGSLQMVEFAYGPTGHNAHYGAVRNPWNVDHITGGSSSGSGSAVARAADLCGARLRHRRLDPDARAFLRRHRLEDHGRPRQPRRRDAAVAVARHRRAAGADRRGLRAAAGPDGGRRSRGSDRLDAAGAGLHGRDHRLAQGPEDRRADRVLCRRSRCRGGAGARRDHRDAQKRGRRNRQGRTAGPAPAHRRLPARARDRSRRLPQALDDRAAAGLRRAGPDAAAERARDSRRVLSRGDALARSGAGGLSRGGHRHRCRAGAGRADAGADHCRERCRQQPRRGGRDPAAHAVHPPGQLSRPAVAFDSRRLHRERLAGRHAADRPLLRRGHAAADRRRVPARDRLSPTGTQGWHEQPRRNPQPQHPLHRRAHGACRQRHLALARRGRGARPARRIRLGQERDLARADAAVAEEADADFGHREGSAAATCWR